jgi:hypothetical protein
MKRSARAAAAAGSLIRAACGIAAPRPPYGVEGWRAHVIVFQRMFELLLSCLSRIDQRFGPAMSGVVMSDHVPDDEVCWCGVPLECHDDLYDAIRGWHHQPDPIPPPLVTGGPASAGGCDRASGQQAA